MNSISGGVCNRRRNITPRHKDHNNQLQLKGSSRIIDFFQHLPLPIDEYVVGIYLPCSPCHSYNLCFGAIRCFVANIVSSIQASKAYYAPPPHFRSSFENLQLLLQLYLIPELWSSLPHHVEYRLRWRMYPLPFPGTATNASSYRKPSRSSKRRSKKTQPGTTRSRTSNIIKHSNASC